MVFRAVVQKPNARFFYAVYSFRIRRRHHGKVRHIDGLTFKVRTAVAKERAFSPMVGNDGTKRRTGNPFQPAENEYACRQHRTRRAGRYQAVRFPFFEHTEGHDKRRILFRFYRFGRNFFHADRFRRMYDLHTARVVFTKGKFCFDLRFVATKNQIQLLVVVQRFYRA